MTVNLEVEARDEGMFTSLKTKLKNTDNLLLYNGVTKTKGLSDDEVGSYRLRLLNCQIRSDIICVTSLLQHTQRENNCSTKQFIVSLYGSSLNVYLT